MKIMSVIAVLFMFIGSNAFAQTTEVTNTNQNKAAVKKKTTYKKVTKNVSKKVKAKQQQGYCMNNKLYPNSATCQCGTNSRKESDASHFLCLPNGQGIPVCVTGVAKPENEMNCICSGSRTMNMNVSPHTITCNAN